MEVDLYVPSFRTASKRMRSRSPTPCEHDRPLKRLSTLVPAAGDRTYDSPLSFQSPHMTSPASPARAQWPSTVLLVQDPAQSVCTPSVHADAGVQDEQWVTLTRNLTLLPVQSTEHETTWSNNEENTMNLHNTTSHSNPCSSMPISLRLSLPPATATGYLQTPDPVAIPTPPIGTAVLPPHSPFSGANTTPLDLREPQPSQRQQAPPRRSRFTLGPRPDCEKCRLGVPGHYAHFD